MGMTKMSGMVKISTKDERINIEVILLKLSYNVIIKYQLIINNNRS